MNKSSALALLLSAISLSLSLFVMFNLDSREKERQQIKEEVYRSIVKELDDELGPVYKELGIKSPQDQKLSSRLRPLLEPLSK